MTQPRIVQVQLSGFAKNCSTRLGVYRKHRFFYSMQRPGPLQELPLEPFLQAHPNTPSKSVRSHKRPLSPGSPNSYSPTKRRILNLEGIFASEKSCKTLMSSGKASPARFTDVLVGPASPARILDFGLPKSHGGEPVERPFPSQTQIPLLPPRKTPIPSHYRRVSPTYHISRGGSTNTEVFNTSSIRPVTVPIVIPRELPPPPDPPSIHYPGFAVFQDTHITIYPPDFNLKRVSNAETHTDLFKENLPPRRKTLPEASLETLKFDVTPLDKSEPVTGTASGAISSCSPMKIDARINPRRMMKEDDLDEEEENDDDQ